MKYLPLFADLAGRECLIVGGGENATRKLRLLLRAGARATVAAAAVTPEISALERDGEVRVEKEPQAAPNLVPHRLSAYALIVVADVDRQTAATYAAAARRSNIPINVVDRPDLSSVVFPGIVDRDPVLVAIGTSGAAPVLVRRLREQIEALLPARLGSLARFAHRFAAAAFGKPSSTVPSRGSSLRVARTKLPTPCCVWSTGQTQGSRRGRSLSSASARATPTC